jgi:hypothetical protein
MDKSLLDIVAKSIGSEVPDVLNISSERKSQHDTVFGKEITGLLPNLDSKEASDQVLLSMIDKIFQKNPEIESYRYKLDFRNIYSNIEKSKCLSFDEKFHLITFDSHTKKFLWMMNKSFLYGGMYLDQTANLDLFRDLFIYFGFTELLNGQSLVETPKTPPHRDNKGATMLATWTEMQEIFLLSHEIAHVVINSGEGANGKGFEAMRAEAILLTSALGGDSFEGLNSEAIENEIAADNFAFELTLNVFGKESKEGVELVCSAVFSMIRYFLWLRIVTIDPEEDYEYKLWLTRSNFFRNKFREAYHWEAPNFINMMLEAMEARMEPAVFPAKLTIEKVRAELGEQFDALRL